MKTKGILSRIIVSPFVFLLMLITAIIHAFIAAWLFIKYGGEWKTYKSDEEKKSIADIYDKLDNIFKEINKKQG